jgi:predicted transcriptional regulator
MSEIPRPSDFELAILRVLWRRGNATVRQIHEDLKQERQLGYATVLKTMQIMLEKGLLERDEEEKAHVYRAAWAEQDTQSSMLRDMLTRVFGGSTRKLVMAALKEAPLQTSEEAELRALLNAQAPGRRNESL